MDSLFKMNFDELDGTPTNMRPPIALATSFGLFMLLGFLAFRSLSLKGPLPEVPELKGVPVLGAMPFYLACGMPQLLGKLISIGDDGISYAKVVNNILVSVHDPAMAREVLSYPETIASR